MPLKYERCIASHNNNQQTLRMRFAAIEKKQDVKGKYLLSANDKAKAEALLQYYKAEEKTMDLFLGEGGTKKYLRAKGRNYYYEMFDDISELIEPLLTKFEIVAQNITSKIKNKYSKKETDTLE